MTDTNELRRLAQAALAGPDGISLNWIKLIQDFQQNAGPATILELLDRLEAAEKERDALRAKMAEMERQEPVGYMPLATKAALEAGGTGVIWNCRDRGAADEPLYALSGAQNVASSQDEWKTLAKDLLREIERQTCAHEETHRGGFLWEICDSCGAKWADDEGGKPEFKWPKVVERAHAMLAAAPSVPEVTDAMAIAFHAALTDGGIGQQEVEEIKTGLRAALAAIPEAKP